MKSVLEIPGAIIDNKLWLRAYKSAILEKVYSYAKLGVLERLKRLVPIDVALILYKILVNKLEAANHYHWRLF